MRIKYNVRSRQLLDIVNEIKTKRIILSPYFQRNYVWREIHKIDFIDTILSGLPFPEIFLAKGDLDVESMITTSCVVDGQQRLSTILDYIDNRFEVKGKKWADLNHDDKSNFLKYEVAIIELDIEVNDPLIEEIFKRLNRTYYALSNIEKLSSEYAPAEIMLLAKFLIGDLKADDFEESSKFELHPKFPTYFAEWAKTKDISRITELIVEKNIFSKYEISRQVHLMYTLNILGTIQTGIYGRNISKEILDEYSEEYPEKNETIDKLITVSNFILNLNFDEKSYWYNKANSFSLIIALYEKIDYAIDDNIDKFKQALTRFEEAIPEEYRIAAKEGVNNKKERLIRDRFIKDLMR